GAKTLGVGLQDRLAGGREYRLVELEVDQVEGDLRRRPLFRAARDRQVTVGGSLGKLAGVRHAGTLLVAHLSGSALARLGGGHLAAVAFAERAVGTFGILPALVTLSLYADT